MARIKIVTAFFDINRQNSEKHPRTNDEYFNYFKFWARINNELVVYCESKHKDTVLKIRDEYGLKDKTEVVIVDDIYNIEGEIFNKMCQIENDVNYQNFRYLFHDPSNYAKYDYIMLMKYWFVAQTAKNESDDCFVAWIDFGFNHGGKKYSDSNDFDFLWDYDFPKKINLFCLCNPDGLSLIDCLQFQLDCVIGGSVIVPRFLCEKFWDDIKQSMLTLLDIGCIDDDQILLLMAYKRNPSLYSIVQCDWFDAFIKCSNNSFSLTESSPMDPVPTIHNLKRTPFIKRIFDRLVWCYRRIRYLDYPQIELHPFLKRMQAKKDTYYRWDK